MTRCRRWKLFRDSKYPELPGRRAVCTDTAGDGHREHHGVVALQTGLYLVSWTTWAEVLR